MRKLSLITTAALTAGITRQLLVLAGTVRSGRFLRQDREDLPGGGGTEAPRFFIVVPVLREAAILAETVAHFQGVARGHNATIVIVTTARETAEASKHTTGGDSIMLAARPGKRRRVRPPPLPGPDGRQGRPAEFRGFTLRWHACRRRRVFRASVPGVL